MLLIILKMVIETKVKFWIEIMSIFIPNNTYNYVYIFMKGCAHKPDTEPDGNG